MATLTAPSPLDRVFHPLPILLLWVGFYTFYSALLVYRGDYPRSGSDSLYRFGYAFLLVWWVYDDRRRRNVAPPCFEFEAFILFATLIALPYYLFKTRGWRGIGLLFLFALLWVTPNLISVVIFEYF